MTKLDPDTVRVVETVLSEIAEMIEEDMHAHGERCEYDAAQATAARELGNGMLRTFLRAIDPGLV